MTREPACVRSRARSAYHTKPSSTGSEGTTACKKPHRGTPRTARARGADPCARACYPVRRSCQVAQLEEHGSEEPVVGGSIPSLATTRREPPKCQRPRSRAVADSLPLVRSVDRRPRSGGLTVPGSDSLEKAHHFGLTVAAVSAQGPDGAELACLRPTRDRLRVNTEKRGDLSGCEKRLARR